MLHISTREMDAAFVRRIVEQQRLDPRPIDGFQELPDALFQTTRWRREVERYAWGRVIFASDRDEDRHFTAVIEGGVDLETGEVTTTAGLVRRLPEWYSELADYISKAPNRVKAEIPPCFGDYTADEICDGGPGPAGRGGACAYRGPCVALQEAAARSKRKPFEMIRELTPEQTIELSRELLQQHSGKRKKHVTPPNDESRGAFVALWKRLSERLYPRAFKFSRDRALPGDVFMIDRTEQSGYVSICCLPNKGRVIPIASVRLKKHGGVDFQLPLEPTHPLLDPVRDHVVAWQDRSFLSAIKRVPARVSVEQACDIVVRAIETNAIELPSLAGADGSR